MSFSASSALSAVSPLSELAQFGCAVPVSAGVCVPTSAGAGAVGVAGDGLASVLSACPINSFRFLRNASYCTATVSRSVVRVRTSVLSASRSAHPRSRSTKPA